jgi:hypothetical protein
MAAVLATGDMAGMSANGTLYNDSDNSDNGSQDVKGVSHVMPFVTGGVIMGACLVLFALFVHMGWIDDLTPRIANRPKQVLKNAMLYHLPSFMKHPLWYPVSWIGWAYHLTYHECFKGIPATGTRKNGNEGPLLKTNLDAVIMLRFHTLLFKVGLLVALLCSLIILPLNWTAGCNVETFGKGTCTQLRENRTFFMRTTIANIPDKIVSFRECGWQLRLQLTFYSCVCLVVLKFANRPN